MGKIDKEQTEKSLADAKANNQKLSTQLKQLKARKEKALADPEFRPIADQTTKEKSDVLKLKRDLEDITKQVRTSQKAIDDSRRQTSSQADKEILDQIREMQKKFIEMILKDPPKTKTNTNKVGKMTAAMAP